MPIDFAQFGWRDGVLFIAVGIGVYVAIMMLRLLQMGKRKAPLFDTDNDATDESLTASAGADTGDDRAAVTSYELPFHFQPAAMASAQPANDAAAVAPAPTFADTPANHLLQQEVHQLRAEVAALREELLDMQASRRVSPQYADAMALARRGFDAHGIADHCGIALGEAELVMALARGADETNEEDEYDRIEPRGLAAGR